MVVDACLGGVRRTVPGGATLNLNFMGAPLDPRITFTRASTATYTDASGTIQTVAVNTPRWDYDPATHALRGVLIEEARTNLALNSANLSVAPWTPIGISGPVAPTVTANAAVAPDGTSTATRAAYPAVGSGVSSINNNIAIAAGVYTFSVWARGAVGGEKIWLSTTPDAVTYYRTPMVLTTSWQRFTLTSGSLAAGTQVMLLGVDMRDAPQTAQPAQTVYLWGAQCELGAFGTSYIPTTSATVTRSVDQCGISPANMAGWYVAPGGTWFAEFIDLDTTATTSIIVGAAATSGAATPIYVANGLALAQWDGSTPLLTANTITLNAVARGVAGYAAGSGKCCLNGGTVVSATLAGGYAMAATGILFFTSSPTATENMLAGYLRRIGYWPRLLSDTEMKQVTA
jgi:hypothetical protein